MVQAAGSEHMPHQLLQRTVESFNNLSLGFVVGYKMMYILFFEEGLKVLFLNSVPASVCNFAGLRPSWKVLSKATTNETPVFDFKGSTHAYSGRPSIQVSRYLYPLFYQLMIKCCKSTKSAFHCESISNTIT